MFTNPEERAQISSSTASLHLPQNGLERDVDADAQTDEEIDRRILQLKTRRNMSKIIMRIPPEILSQISLAYVDAMLERDPFDPWQAFQSHINQWIIIAHICHHWREIALCTPRLWARFKAVSFQFVQEMLVRSKAVPLSINMMCAQRLRQESLKQVLNSFSRIQEIEFQFAPYVYEGLESSYPLEAPQLRRIALCHLMVDNHDPPIPPIFDACKLPNLTSLTVCHFHIDWTKTLFSPSLTHLVVETLNQEDRVFDKLFSALEKMTKLRHFELRLGLGLVPLLPLNLPLNQSRNCPIAFPDLDHLQLQMSATFCVYLLSRLEYPPKALVTLQLNTYSFEEDFDEIDELATIVHAKLSRPNVSPVLSAAFWTQTDSHGLGLNAGTHFAFWTEILSAETTIKAGEGILPLLRIHAGPSIMSNGTFTWIGRFAPLAHIKSLFVCGDSSTGIERIPISVPSWHVVLGDIQNIDTLVLKSQAPLPCITSICEHAPVPGFPDRPSLRNLIRLHIYNATFHPTVADNLLAFLQIRRRVNLGMQLLKLGSCQWIDNRDIDKFSNFVDEVDWDEHINFDPPNDRHYIDASMFYGTGTFPDPYYDDVFDDWGWGE
ncbi:hypothetical protein NLI96_g4877 [Meripilus lineatus]|uniref:F-box domain-containing protein n=1 Tax=Meripilus lineatus TaxID=2056292 RepID=A0AAD5YFA3_9APHY|nr:hypothetical protein NLI96_g4877 [Physisporinus lineatus]